MQKSIALLSLSLSVLLILSGCKGRDIPGPTATPDATPSQDVAEIIMTTQDLDSIQISYEKEKWVSPMRSSDGCWVLLYADSADSVQACNITIEKTSPEKEQIDESYLAWLTNSIRSKNGSYITVIQSELRTINETNVAYVESTLKFTNELITTMLNDGLITKNDLDFLGGREALLSAAPVEQISMHAKIGEDVYVFAGTYYSEAQKQIVVNDISAMIASAKIIDG